MSANICEIESCVRHHVGSSRILLWWTKHIFCDARRFLLAASRCPIYAACPDSTESYEWTCISPDLYQSTLKACAFTFPVELDSKIRTEIDSGRNPLDQNGTSSTHKPQTDP